MRKIIEFIFGYDLTLICTKPFTEIFSDRQREINRIYNQIMDINAMQLNKIWIIDEEE